MWGSVKEKIQRDRCPPSWEVGAEVWDHIAEVFQQIYAWDGVPRRDLRRKVTVLGAACLVGQ